MTKVTPEHVEARLESIRGAAITMFVRKGVEGATMQEIASEAGLSAGAIYRYYASKEQLLEAVWNHCFAENEFEAVSVLPESPLERLIALGRIHWQNMKRPDARTSMILQIEATLAAARRPGDLGVQRRKGRIDLIDTMETLIREAQASGDIDPTVDSRALALMLLSVTQGLNIFALELAEDLNQDSVLAVLIEMLKRLTPR